MGINTVPPPRLLVQVKGDNVPEARDKMRVQSNGSNKSGLLRQELSDLASKNTRRGLPWWLNGSQPANAGDAGLIPGPGRSGMQWSD